MSRSWSRWHTKIFPPETVGSQIDELVELLLNHFSVRVVGVCLVIKRAEPMFNTKVEVLNRYLRVVIDRPRVFVWRHKILDSPSHDFLLEDGVHLNPRGQYLLYRSYRGAILKAVNILNKFEWIMLGANTLCCQFSASFCRVYVVGNIDIIQIDIKAIINFSWKPKSNVSLWSFRCE